MRKPARMPDPYILLLFATVGLAALLPARGAAAPAVDAAATGVIALLFFLYGARLSTREAVEGLRHWRLHLTVLTCTFVLFPLLGLGLWALVGALPDLLTDDLATGLLFLCLVPSTVQSSIAFTSIARGNVSAAIAAGSFSSVAGVFLTPLLAAALIGGGAQGGGFDVGTLPAIAGQILVPFVAGQLLRRWIGGFVTRHRAVLSLVDRGSILVIVYAAFSEGVNAGIWDEVSWWQLLVLLAAAALLLAVMLALTTWGSRRLRFSRADRIVVVFAGSKKSLAAGLPMASVLFGAEAAMAVLPLMVFHQLQLVVCAWLAARWGRGAGGLGARPEGGGQGPGQPPRDGAGSATRQDPA